MNTVSRLASYNPALIIGAVVVFYMAVLFLRRNLGWLLLAAWTALCLSLLLLPGGQATLTQIHLLPGVVGRVECVESSVVARVPWEPTASAYRLPLCRFQGLGVGDIAASAGAASALTSSTGAGSALRRAYGH